MTILGTVRTSCCLPRRDEPYDVRVNNATTNGQQPDAHHGHRVKMPTTIYIGKGVDLLRLLHVTYNVYHAKHMYVCMTYILHTIHNMYVFMR